MVRRKYQIYVDENTVFGLCYDPNMESCFLGGYGKFIELYERVVDKAFEKRRFDIDWTAQNKVKFIFRCDETRLKSALECMEQCGYVVKPITSFGRMFT